VDKQILIDALHAQDSQRDRSKQTAIGVSQLGGCRRQVWHKLQGHAETNPTLRLASIMGTAIHATIEKALQDKGYLLEYHVAAKDGLPPANIDCFDPNTGTVTDFKTITKKNADYFVTKQKRYQVHTYAYLMAREGHLVSRVQLIGIPRDGNENDVFEWSEPYDENVALEALQWLKDVEAMTDVPAPERDATTFCKSYCGFYGSLCSGIGKDISGDAITDELVTKAASDYVAISNEIKVLEAKKDAAKEALAGVSGITFEGIKVSWSEVAGRSTPDMTEITNLLKTHVGEDCEVPMKQGQPTQRLVVK
jgi:hypothetical protein